MDLSTVHCRTASIHGGLPTMSKRAWCSPKSRPSIRRSLKAATCFFCSPLIIRADQLCHIRAAIPAFIRVIDSKTVAFPCYDGNGMFYSMGNLLGN